LWQNAWAEFVPFLAYSPGIRKVIYSTNAIESLHARFRRSVRASGQLPNEQAAVKCLYLTIRSLDHRTWQSPLDHPFESSNERVCRHLRRPIEPNND